MEQSINVLIVNDKALVREGWMNALSGSKLILGEQMSTQDLFAGSVPSTTPDVVLLNAKTFSYLVSSKTFAQIKKVFPLMKTLVICSKNDEAEKLHAQGADKTIQQPLSPEEKLINELIGLFNDDEDLCEQYDTRLKLLSSGPKDAYAYEILLFEIIQLLFKEDLVNGQRQSRTYHGTDRRDAVFFNRANHSFWVTVKNCYESNQVVVENKNTTINKEYFVQALDYLQSPLGRFGILTGRKPLSKNVRLKQLSALNAGKLILFLSDEDIHSMLAYKAAGIEPSEYLQHLYNELVRLAQ